MSPERSRHADQAGYMHHTHIPGVSGAKCTVTALPEVTMKTMWH